MKKLIILFCGTLALAACGNGLEKKANEKLMVAKAAYERGDYEEAKLQIDSIKILYPKAFEARKAGQALMLDVETKTQQKTLAYLDSAFQAKTKEFNAIKDKFTLEKDAEYQQVGNYLWPTQTIEKNMHRSYLRFQVNEQGIMSMTSIYCGAGNTHGLVVKSMLEEWKHTGDSVYYEYAKIYADSLIDADGHIKTMKYLSFNIDNVNGGKILFDLYAQTGDERYKIAMDTLRKQMAEQPRTSEGGFWHKLRYPHQMWLDGIFMASPYLVQYGATFNEPALFDEATKQILLINSKTYDPATGLYYHGWDESREQKWSNPETGCSPNFWSRSIGWYGAAIVDVLDFLPQETA